MPEKSRKAYVMFAPDPKNQKSVEINPSAREIPRVLRDPNDPQSSYIRFDLVFVNFMDFEIEVHLPGELFENKHKMRTIKPNGREVPVPLKKEIEAGDHNREYKILRKPGTVLETLDNPRIVIPKS